MFRVEVTSKDGNESIPMKSDPDITFYHILIQFEYEYGYYRIRIQNGCRRFGFLF
jgi:hypothetical protein